jgi:hypothetical protein
MCLSCVLASPLQTALPSRDRNLFILKITYPSANDQLIITAGTDRIPSNRHLASAFLSFCMYDLPCMCVAYFDLEDGSNTFLRSVSIDALHSVTIQIKTTWMYCSSDSYNIVVSMALTRICLSLMNGFQSTRSFNKVLWKYYVVLGKKYTAFILRQACLTYV